MITQVGAVNSFKGEALEPKKEVNKAAIAAGVAGGVVALGALAYFAPNMLDKFVKNMPENMAEAKWYQKAANFVSEKTTIFKDFVNNTAIKAKDAVTGLFKKGEKAAEEVAENA